MLFLPTDIPEEPENLTDNQTNELIQMISKTSNSQNKVSDADFFANHPFHGLMKNYSKNLSVPGVDYNTYWFYERARGEYAQEMMFVTEKQKAIFEKTHPKSKYLRKTDFAKYCSIYNEHPDWVSQGSTTNFNNFAKRINDAYTNNQQAKYSEVFFKEMTGVALMYRELEPLISPKKQSWFHGSYRANVLCYAISLFFHLVRERYPDYHLNLLILWDRGISEEFLDQLVEICKLVYYRLTDPDRPEENVTQWAKRAKCWDNMKEQLNDIELNDALIRKYLVSKTVAISTKKDAKKDTAIIMDAEAYNIVFDSVHMKAWVPLSAFVNDNPKYFNDLSREDRIYLGKMRNVVQGKGKDTPTASECKRALEILNEAEIYGFRYR